MVWVLSLEIMSGSLVAQPPKMTARPATATVNQFDGEKR